MEEMHPKLKKRITAFYVAGVINGLLCLYVLINGFSFLAPDTARTLAIVFLVFTIVDFYFPYSIKKKWLAEQAKRARGSATPAK